MICHRIGAIGRRIILHTQIPHSKLIPVFAVLLIHLNVLCKIDRNGGNVYLYIPPRTELQMLPIGKFYHKLLNERSYVVVGNHLAFPFLDA